MLNLYLKKYFEIYYYVYTVAAFKNLMNLTISKDQHTFKGKL